MQTKKIHVLIAIIAAFALLLSACGNNAANNNSGANASSPAPSAAPSASSDAGTAGDAETVTYHADNGDVQVPKNPQRIVDLTAFYTGFFLAIGVKPVGVLQNAMDNPYFEGKLDGVQTLSDDATPEHVLALKPDLIIAYTGTEGLDKLAEIAPVVAVEYGKRPYRDQLLEFGKLTNKEAEAKAWVAQWDQKINDLKPKVQAAVGDKTVSILNPYAKGLYAFGTFYGRGGEIIYGEFGLKAPAEFQKEVIDSGTGWATISMEKLPQFAGDIVFTCPWSGDTSDPKVVYDSAIWKSLPAVKAGNVFQLNPKADTYNDPVSLESQLDFIANSLLSVK
ncbi:iron(3+)-hydroxamate-binding protein fhuD [Paenibacillus protaetiae]|uniref:Iron(3+)-hydroxamate-binding protein fhuD n=1 Tax=Paenibacillus protaetiae TaxID=2509456 RepID=A0A4P6EYT3_9BACL|nr:ABC transporter substrate-binding protein [Paenibacillus protaetiae]QAY68590.1 iron(3+)-hydroxamate-binding protein fhuD [Paenibacillus protaetiae]